MTVPLPPCDGCTREATSMFSFPCIECSSTDNYRHFERDVPAKPMEPDDAGMDWRPISELYGTGQDEGIAFRNRMYEGQVFNHGGEGWKVVLWDILDGETNARIIFDYMDVASLEDGKALVGRTVRGAA